MDKLTAYIDAITKLLQGTKPWIEKAGRLTGIFDKSAWLLMVPAFGALYYTDPAMAATMAQWTLFALSLAGAAVIVSRVVFPQLDISDLLAQVLGEQKSTAAAIVIAAVVLFVAALFLGLVFWAKT